MATSVLKEFLLKFTADDSGLKKASDGTKKVDSDLKKLAKSLIKTMLGWAGLTAAILKFASKLKEAIKWTIEMNKTLEKEAKALNKSTEAARAHLVALKVMGKTMEEINKDESLKKVYNDLVKLGEAMALPNSAKGLSTLNDVIDAWTKIKYAAYYALQWIWYYMQRYLKTPLDKIKNFFNGTAESFASKIKEWMKPVSKILSEILEIVWSLIKSIRDIWKFIKDLFSHLSGKGKLTLVAIAGVLTLILNKGLLIKAAIAGIILLVDDYLALLRGEKTALSVETWEKIVAIVIKIKNIVFTVINAIMDAINAVVVYFGGDPVFTSKLHIDTNEEISDKAKMYTGQMTREEYDARAEQRAAATKLRTQGGEGGLTKEDLALLEGTYRQYSRVTQYANTPAIFDYLFDYTDTKERDWRPETKELTDKLGNTEYARQWVLAYESALKELNGGKTYVARWWGNSDPLAGNYENAATVNLNQYNNISISSTASASELTGEVGNMEYTLAESGVAGATQ